MNFLLCVTFNISVGLVFFFFYYLIDMYIILAKLSWHRKTSIHQLFTYTFLFDITLHLVTNKKYHYRHCFVITCVKRSSRVFVCIPKYVLFHCSFSIFFASVLVSFDVNSFNNPLGCLLY